MFVFLLLIFLCVVNCNTLGSFHSQTTNSQMAVDNDEYTTFAVAYNKSIAVISLQESSVMKDCLNNSNIYIFPNYFVSFVGLKADFLKIRRRIIRLESECYESSGIAVKPSNLVLSLSDILQDDSLDCDKKRLLAFSALVIDTENKYVFRVVTSGSNDKCDFTFIPGVAIGYRSEIVNQWFNTRGKNILNQYNLEANIPISPNNDIVNPEEVEAEERNNNIKKCLELAWMCLNETIGSDKLFSNYYVELATASYTDDFDDNVDHLQATKTNRTCKDVDEIQDELFLNQRVKGYEFAVTFIY